MRPMGTAPLCRMIAAAMVIACVGGCGRSNRDTAADETGTQATVEPGPTVTPTSDASIALMAAEAPARFATLQEVLTQTGHRCAAVTKGVLTGGLDGTDEWRVECSDSGPWQVWFSNDSGTSVEQCTNANCT